MVSGRNQQVKRSVFVIGKHPIVRQQLAALIRHEADLEISGDAPDVTTASPLIKQLGADLVILDLSSKWSQGFDFIRQLKASRPKVRALIFSLHDHNMFRELAMQAGADDFLTAQEAGAKILPAIRKAMEKLTPTSVVSDSRLKNSGAQVDLTLSALPRPANQPAEIVPLQNTNDSAARHPVPSPQISGL